MTANPVPLQAALVSHPDTPCASVASIKAVLRWEKSGVLALVYTLNGSFDAIRLPPYRQVDRADGLWRHTCFEAFIGAKNDAEYYEFNFSPSGQWALYEFRNYRDGGPIADNTLEPAISVRQEAGTLELSAEIFVDRLPGLQLDVRLCVGLSAVIEDTQGRFSYWALKHAPGKPDFHHPDSFTLETQSPVAGADAIAYTAKA